MLDKVLIFLLFLGPLIFFHELGHFFFARLFGVRVEVFSIGFGPKILKWARSGTEYAISIIPLGGYVKMFGDDPLSDVELTPEEKKVAYTHKSKWARFWIVFGGPLANFILAYVLFVGLSVHGEKTPQVNFGQMSPSSIYVKAGFQSGDTIFKIEDLEIKSIDDFGLVPKKITTITVKRGGEEVVIPFSISGKDFLKTFLNATGAGLAATFYDSKAQLYGLSFDPNLFDAKAYFWDFLHTKKDIYLLKLKDQKINGFEDLVKANEEAVKIDSSNGIVSTLAKRGLYRNDLFVSSIVMGSPADKAKLLRGDVIFSVNGQEMVNFSHFKEEVQNLSTTNSTKLVVLREGQKFTVDITPESRVVGDKNILAVGIESGAMLMPTKMVDVAGRGFGESLSIGFLKTWDGIVKTMVGFSKIVMSEVPLDSLGGPIAIAKVASDSFNVGLTIFLRFMAMISINLGVINLFPIPVLDGGHIVFIFLEFLNRGPLSRKKIQIAQQVGVSMLFLLIFVALFNDISRLI